MILAALLALGQPAPSQATPAGAGPIVHQSRLLALPDDAVAYVPANASIHPPLLVLLHGAGRGRLDMIQHNEVEADKRGIVLLAPTSKGITWDAVSIAMTPPSGDSPLEMKLGRSFSSSRDSRRVEAAIANLAKIVPFEPKHIVLAGFSDGATFALAMGMARSEPFSAVIAWSPGIPIETSQPARGRPVFVSHGRQDPVLSFGTDCGEIIPLLQSEGAVVSFVSFDGKHEVPQEQKDEFLDAIFGPVPGAPLHKLPSAKTVCPCNAMSEQLGVVGEPTGYRKSQVTVQGFQKGCGA